MAIDWTNILVGFAAACTAISAVAGLKNNKAIKNVHDATLDQNQALNDIGHNTNSALSLAKAAQLEATKQQRAMQSDENSTAAERAQTEGRIQQMESEKPLEKPPDLPLTP
jgi:hypothetical protein